MSLEVSNIGMSTSEWYYREYKVLSNFLHSHLGFLLEEENRLLLEEHNFAINMFRSYQLKENAEKMHNQEFPDPNFSESFKEYTDRITADILDYFASK